MLLLFVPFHAPNHRERRPPPHLASRVTNHTQHFSVEQVPFTRARIYTPCRATLHLRATSRPQALATEGLKARAKRDVGQIQTLLLGFVMAAQLALYLLPEEPLQG